MDAKYRFHRDWDCVLAHYLNPIRIRCLALRFPPQSKRRAWMLKLGQWYNGLYFVTARKGLAARVLLCTLTIKLTFLPLK